MLRWYVDKCIRYVLTLTHDSVFDSVRVNNSGVNADFDCTGNQFYTWGGLPAFMALSEAGFYA
eukprot:m.868299 g.868299  ORF g.868299 m.868299 type:complete len:63 (-) comp23560_c0_seq5:326-514(-)